ncbi:Polyamine oxidase [Stylophora pistillata]|uniref:Polyamine oxidase n=1 Tax=Stylophora pistillata TaxID=50429 RepID=A0A2B4RLD3_STYPI|nr:Polyamine oxidase [Stylophora pistillata]
MRNSAAESQPLRLRLLMYVTIKIILFLTLLFLVDRSLSSPIKQNKTKVLILGAGLAGIRAAKTLLDRNITDILILEGKNYTGGRIHAMKFTNYTIEAGANWIHFVNEDDTKPFLERKEARSVRVHTYNYSNIIMRDEDGKDVTDFAVVREFDDKVHNKIEEFQEERRTKNFPDMPARVGLQLMGWKGKRPIERAIEYFELDYEFAKPPEEVSFYSLFVSGEEFLVPDERGVWSMFEDLSKPLEKKTISGVLAKDLVTLEPALPDWKKEAIYKIPLSTYTKIYLKFPKKFWDDNEYILYVSKDLGRFPVWQDLSRPGINSVNSGMLEITVTGAEGRRIEGQSFNETKAEIMEILRKVYGEGIPEATDIYYHRWSKEPLTQGAFSDPVVGMTSKDWENIGKNLGRLYFAGEATSEEWYGYMQGAYLTGDKKGKMIAENIFLHEPISKPGKPKSEATLVKVTIPGVFLLSYLHSLLWN